MSNPSKQCGVRKPNELIYPKDLERGIVSEMLEDMVDEHIRQMSNPSKLDPVEFKILVQLDKVEDVTKGGIIIPITLKDKQQMHQVQATLIAHGGNAFTEPTWLGAIPKVGDRVYVAKNAGYQVVGRDGEKYQLMNDKDIAAIIRE